VCVERANHVGDTTFYEYTPYLDDLTEAWWAGYAAWSTWSYDNPAWPVWCRERKERKMLTLLVAQGQATSSNFAFLAKRNPQLERIGALSERYFSDDPVISLIRVRQFGELLAQLVAARSGLFTDADGTSLSVHRIVSRSERGSRARRQAADRNA
jgi:hypothetical protein